MEREAGKVVLRETTKDVGEVCRVNRSKASEAGSSVGVVKNGLVEVVVVDAGTSFRHGGTVPNRCTSHQDVAEDPGCSIKLRDGVVGHVRWEVGGPIEREKLIDGSWLHPGQVLGDKGVCVIGSLDSFLDEDGHIVIHPSDHGCGICESAFANEL